MEGFVERGKPLRALVLSLALVLAAQFAFVGTARALTAAEVAMLKSPERQAILEEGARKEGKLTWYSALIVDQMLRPLADAFEKKYPYIKVTYWRANSTKIIQRILAESRANAMQADILEGPSLTQTMVEANVLQPFWTPAFDLYPADYRHPQGLWAATRFTYHGTAYNTKLIAAADSPKTYDDLLNPKWRDKIAWVVGSDSGATLFITNLRLSMGEAKTEAYLKELSKQNIVNFSGSARNLVNRVMEGEYPIALNIFLHHPLISAQKGAPVTSQPMEPVPSLTGAVMIPKGAKNPHAAMLLLDFVLSKEGQEIYRDADYFPAHPEVDPKPILRPVVPRLAGLKQTVISPEKQFEDSKPSNELFKKYFGQGRSDTRDAASGSSD